MPSLIAGVAIIPTLYLIGLRTVGRVQGLVAAALATFAPFMIYYSAEARGYALMMASVSLSTLALLLAIDRRQARWWVAYAVFSSAAVYTHYTCIFVLGVQVLWVLLTQPEARRAALLANLAVVVAYVPWLSGLANDLASPTTDILSQLQPFDAHWVRESLEHWSVGYPYGSRVPLTDIPGLPGLIMLGLAALLTLAGLLQTRGQRLWSALTRRDRR